MNESALHELVHAVNITEQMQQRYGCVMEHWPYGTFDKWLLGDNCLLLVVLKIFKFERRRILMNKLWIVVLL